MERLIRFFLVVLLGVALGYSWATYHATVKFERYNSMLVYKQYELSTLQMENIKLRGRVEMYQTIIGLYLRGKIDRKVLVSAANETKRP